MYGLSKFQSQLYKNQSVQLKRSSKSQNQFLKDKHQFVPFVHERDSMNRLLSTKLQKSNFKNNKKPSQQLQILSKYSLTNSIKCYDVSENVNTISQEQDIVNMKFFKKNFIDNDVNNKPKSRIRRKSPILVEYITNPHPQINMKLFEVNQENFKLKKTQSAILSNRENYKLKKNQQKQQRTKTSHQRRKIRTSQFIRNDKKQPINVINEEDDNNQNHSFKIKVRPRKDYPQLQRFRRMQNLSIKVFNNFEQGHSKFLQKIKHTKMLAIKIQKQLQA